MKKKKLSWEGYKKSDFPMITLDCTKPSPLTELFAKSPKVFVDPGYGWLEEEDPLEKAIQEEKKARESLREWREDFHHRNLIGNLFNYGQMSPDHSHWFNSQGPCVEQYTNISETGGTWTTGAEWAIPAPNWTYNGEPWPPEGVSDDFKKTVGKAMEEIMESRHELYRQSWPAKFIKGTLTPKEKKQMEEMAKRVMMFLIEKKFIDDKITVVEYMKIEKELIKVLKDEEED